MEQVTINLGNPRTPRREREELIQRIYGKEKRPSGMRRSKDLDNAILPYLGRW